MSKKKKIWKIKKKKKKKKTSFFSIVGILVSKKCYSFSFPILGECNLTKALQSSPFPISGEQYERDGGGGLTEILVSNIGCKKKSSSHSKSTNIPKQKIKVEIKKKKNQA